MAKFSSVNHHIQKHIIDVLVYQKNARFRDLRPPRVDTNLFTYHLTRLVKSGLVQKVDGSYTLDAAGLSYVDRVIPGQGVLRTQPKIITMFVIQNGEGDILLQRRTKQPFIDTWTLAYGKVRIDDSSVSAAAQREVREKLAIESQAVEHAGECYIRVRIKDEVLSTTLVHVFRFYSDDIQTTDNLIWARPHKVGQLDLAPAVEDIMTRTFFKDPFFFEEYDVDWYNEEHES